MDNIPFFIASLFAILTLVATWKVFVKASIPGVSALIPIYNVYITMKIAGKPGWWVVLYFIPLVNLVIHIVASISLAQNFGKSVAFGLGLVFLPFVFYPVLAFSDATYSPRPAAV